MRSGAIILTCLGLLAGFPGGQMLCRSTGNAPVAAASPNLRTRSKAAAGISATPAGSHDHATLAARMKLATAAESVLSRQVMRLDTPALKRLIGESAADPRLASGEGNEKDALLEVLRVACGELYQREGMRSLEWGAAVAEKEGREGVMQELIIQAAALSPELAFPWVNRFKKEYPGFDDSDIRRRSIAMAEAGGADAVIRFMEVFGFDPFADADGAGYAKDFDFAELLDRSAGCDGTIQMAVTRWAAEDGEAAWAGVMSKRDKAVVAGESSGIASDYVGSIYLGVAAGSGEEAATRWLAEKLNSVPDGPAGEMIPGPDVIPAGLDALFIASLRRDEDKVEFVGELLADPRGVERRENEPRDLQEVLELLDSETLRADAVAGIVRKTGLADFYGVSPWSHENVPVLMDFLKFSPAAREKVMVAVREQERAKAERMEERMEE